MHCLSWVHSTFTLVYLGMRLGLGMPLAYSSRPPCPPTSQTAHRYIEQFTPSYLSGGGSLITNTLVFTSPRNLQPRFSPIFRTFSKRSKAMPERDHNQWPLRGQPYSRVPPQRTPKYRSHILSHGWKYSETKWWLLRTQSCESLTCESHWLVPVDDVTTEEILQLVQWDVSTGGVQQAAVSTRPRLCG